MPLQAAAELELSHQHAWLSALKGYGDAAGLLIVSVLAAVLRWKLG